MHYWYNVETGQVEQDDNADRAQNRMGPYATEADARAALEKARERTAAWDEQERREAAAEGRDPDDHGIFS